VTVAAATVARTGLVVSFRVPAGAKAATVRILRTQKKRTTVLARRVVKVKRGVNKVRVKPTALRRKVKRGRVVVEVRLVRADGRAGAPRRTIVRIV
jgi:hypothetical protein